MDRWTDRYRERERERKIERSDPNENLGVTFSIKCKTEMRVTLL